MELLIIVRSYDSHNDSVHGKFMSEAISRWGSRRKFFFGPLKGLKGLWVLSGWVWRSGEYFVWGCSVGGIRQGPVFSRAGCFE